MVTKHLNSEATIKSNFAVAPFYHLFLVVEFSIDFITKSNILFEKDVSVRKKWILGNLAKLFFVIYE